jgi:hypothetical protein
MFTWDSKTCKERQLVWKWKFESKSLEGKNYGLKGKKMDERKQSEKMIRLFWIIGNLTVLRVSEYTLIVVRNK